MMLPEMDPQDGMPAGMDDEQSGAGGGGFVGTKNLMMQPGNPMAGQWNGVRYLGTGSTKPHEYLGMTRVTDEEVAQDARIIALQNLQNLGHMDIPYVMWFTYELKKSVDGEGRKEVLAAVTGIPMQRENAYQRGLNGMRNRIRSFGHRQQAMTPEPMRQ